MEEYFTYVLRSGYKMAYVDSGRGEAVVMAHGNPTWAFFYRNLIRYLSGRYRCIAPDNVGFGASANPTEKGEYSLASHIRNLEELVIEKLNLKKFHLIVHDWGGPIGLSLAVKYLDRVKSVTILNTAAFISKDIPKRIRICRTRGLGEFLVCGLNVFVKGVVRMGTTQGLEPSLKEGYCFPYGRWEDRRGIYELLREIPTKAGSESYQIIKDLEEKIEMLKEKKIFICWGGKDFCFHDGFYNEWKKRLPHAQCKYLKDAGHLVLEDGKEEAEKAIGEFLLNVR